MTTSTSIIAASYNRVSTRVQGRSGYSLGAQHQSDDAFAAAHSWALPPHLRFRDGEDENASGADYDLPGLNAMLAAARRHEFQILIVPDVDRFARSMTKSLVLEEQLNKYGAQVVYQRVPVENTPEGRMLKNNLMAFAEYEREKIKLRTMTGRRRKAEVGKVVGAGAPPYGYRFTYESVENQQRACGLEPDPVTAPIAVRILRAVHERSTLDIADELNFEGIPSPTGKRWTNKVIQRMATNPAYVGTWIYGRHGRRATPEQHDGVGVTVPALISRSEWEANQRALDARRTMRRVRIAREDDPSLLRGMLTCGCCGGALSVTMNSGTRYYRCGPHTPSIAKRLGKPVCSFPDVHAVALEQELWQIIRDTLFDPDALDEALALARSQHETADDLRRDRLASCDTAIAQARRRLDSAIASLIDVTDDEIRATFRRQSEEIAARLHNLKAERETISAEIATGLSADQADAIRAYADDLREGIAQISPAAQRWIFEKLELRGTLERDDAGKRLGRKYSFRLSALEVRMPLLRQSSLFRNRVALRSSSPLVPVFALVAA